MSKSKALVHIYGCGGCGVNQIRDSLRIPTDTVGYSPVKYTAVDTSDSNITDDMRGRVGIYRIPGVDGMGKDRTFALKQCRPHIEPLLSEHQPGTFNIFIFSLSGGTGSTVAPLALAECIRRGIPAIGIAVGNFSNGKEAINTRDGFATLQKIAQMVEAPMPISFHWIESENNIPTIDQTMDIEVKTLCILNSGANDGMDYKDIVNWLNYHRIVKVAPQLVELEVFTGSETETVTKAKGVISAATLYVDRDQPPLAIGQAYDTFGTLPKVFADASKSGASNKHFLLTIGRLAETVSKIDALADKAIKDIEKLNKTAIPSLKGVGADDDDFFITS